MSIHYGLTDYGRMRYMLRMADLLKEKKQFEAVIKEEPGKAELMKPKIDAIQKKAKDIL